MKLSKRESLIFDFMKSKVDEELSIIEITDHLKKHDIDATSKSTNICIKYMGAKIPEIGFMVKRCSDLGRGNIGKYKLIKLEEAV